MLLAAAPTGLAAALNQPNLELGALGAKFCVAILFLTTALFLALVFADFFITALLGGGIMLSSCVNCKEIFVV